MSPDGTADRQADHPRRSGRRAVGSRARRRLLGVPAAAAVVLLAAGCGAGPDATGTGGAAPGAAEDTAIDGSITVFAAASLSGTFSDLAETFEDAHPGAEVTLTFAGSSDLVTQIVEGAPADVLASADTRTMRTVADEGLLGEAAVDFATNTLQLAVPPDNPAGIASLADAARSGVKTVVCAARVPCGAAAVAVEEAAGVDLTPVSEESSVSDVLGKVTSGEADAGLVYVTDVLAAGDAVLGIGVARADAAVTTYPIAPLAGSPEAATAGAFVAFVTGPEGRSVLQAAGFGAP
jgi:molybdate transport system substrate-binding protein